MNAFVLVSARPTARFLLSQPFWEAFITVARNLQNCNDAFLIIYFYAALSKGISILVFSVHFSL